MLTSEKLFEELQEFVCYHQGKIIEYEHEIANLHKKLKKANSSNAIISELSDKLISLYDCSFKMIEQILDTSFSKLKTIYDTNNLSFTIKVASEHEDGNTYISDLYRDKDNFFFSKARRASEHTPFYNILLKNEKFYISNDLEEDFKNNQYRNPRLNGSEINNLIENNITWENCWVKHDTEKELKYYNSLLVIPLTLKNNPDLTDDFKKDFFNNCKTCEGMVWGFFCLDSVEKNIFSSNEIKYVSRIIADLLSLYFIFYYEHTDGSESFNDALKKVLDSMEDEN